MENLYYLNIVVHLLSIIRMADTFRKLVLFRSISKDSIC